jgi:integrase
MRCNIITTDEITVLLPDDEKEFEKVWNIYDDDKHDLMFGIMFHLILHAGMRPGEGSSVEKRQIYPEYNSVLIDQ